VITRAIREDEPNTFPQSSGDFRPIIKDFVMKYLGCGKDGLPYARGGFDAELFRKECCGERKSKFPGPRP
jgi:hypothetical protein